MTRHLITGLLALALTVSSSVGIWYAADCTAGPVSNAALSSSREGGTPTPGLVIQGHVWPSREGGPGLAGVSILRGYASYPGVAVATTDQAGYYQSDLGYIPGDEMVTVWAQLGAYTCAPAQYYWRHYYGYEVRTLDFVARPSTVVYVPVVQSNWSAAIRADNVSHEGRYHQCPE